MLSYSKAFALCGAFIALFCATESLGPRKRVKRLSNAIDAQKNEFPSMVLLQNGPRDSHICGGSLITAEWVLTAAHCVEPVSGLQPKAYKVTLGELDRMAKDEDEITVAVDSVFEHPQYNKKTHENDIGLVKLRYPVDLGQNNNIKLACLAMKETPIKEADCWTIGYGKVGSAAKIPLTTRLKKLKVTEFDHDNCKKTLKDKILEELNENHFCMVTDHNPSPESLTSNGGACSGDSGGPVQCMVRKKWHQVGVTWLTANCEIHPTVYVKISAYEAWISEVTKYQTPSYCGTVDEKMGEEQKEVSNSSETKVFMSRSLNAPQENVQSMQTSKSSSSSSILKRVRNAARKVIKRLRGVGSRMMRSTVPPSA